MPDKKNNNRRKTEAIQPCQSLSPAKAGITAAPKIHDPPNREYAKADLQIQSHSDIIYGDSEYSWDDYIQS